MPETSTGLRLGLAQINSTVGDIDGNAAKIRGLINRAEEDGLDLLLFPEMALPGYPAEDLNLRPDFIAAVAAALESIAADVPGDLVVLLGFCEAGDGERHRAHNSMAVLRGGQVETIYRKHRLPNYDVFDEERHFTPGNEPAVVDVAGTRVGLSICEDGWYEGPPITAEAEMGARLIVNASASPYYQHRGREREPIFAARAVANRTYVAFCNLVGGQDDLVFDGQSFVLDPRGEVIARAKQFAEDLLVCSIPIEAEFEPTAEHLPGTLSDLDELYAALLTGLRDYIAKNGFSSVLLGLSGGIDSALVALLASDAIGPKRVTCVVMPSPHSSTETQEDARRIARNLGTELVEVPIGIPIRAYDEVLTEVFSGLPPDITEENLQARIRADILMAVSNKRGSLTLATGNKSEMAVGYTTLYGDMAGGIAPIRDVYKTLVFDLVRHRNNASERELIPASVIERPPSAELRPGQVDTDSLPPYPVLDQILEAYIERDESRLQLIDAGFDPEMVARVLAMVDHAEHKRRQGPPAIRVTRRAFGRDRRMPITNCFRS